MTSTRVAGGEEDAYKIGKAWLNGKLVDSSKTGYDIIFWRNTKGLGKQQSMSRTSNFIDAYRRGEYAGNVTPPKPIDFTDEYLKAPPYFKEAHRTKALWYYRLLGNQFPSGFRPIGALAKRLFKMSTVMISFVDDQYRTALSFNFDTEELFQKEDTFCAHAVLRARREVFLVPDVLADWRFANGPRGRAGVRFYAGSPLLTEGVSIGDDTDRYSIGTICLLDTSPHDTFDAGEQEKLNLLADLVMQELKNHINSLRLRDRDRMSTALTDYIQASPIDPVNDAVTLIKDVLCVEESAIIPPGQTNADIDREVIPLNCSIWESQDLRKSAIVVPVHENDKLTGHLVAFTNDSHHVFDAQDLNFIKHTSRFVTTYLQTALIKKANSAKTTFMQSVTHELRTPLHGILTTCELLLESQLTPSDKGMVNVIQSSGKNLIGVINGLLDFHRYEQGDVHVNVATVNFLELQQEVGDAVTFSLKERTRLILLTNTNTPEFDVETDLSLVKHVWLNLLSNAIKSIPDTLEGVVRFSLLKLANGYVSTTVEDNGRGISEQFVRERLFLPFQKENDFSQGVGLGLTTSLQISRALGGSLTIDSEVGRGTKATFIIPLRAKDVAGANYPNPNQWHYRLVMKNEAEADGVISNLKLLGLDEAPGTEIERQKINIVTILEYDLVEATALHEDHLMPTGYGMMVCDAEATSLASSVIEERKRFTICPRPVGLARLHQVLRTLDRAFEDDEVTARKATELVEKELKTLIVDDNAVNRNMLAMFCRKRKMKYSLASDGLQGFNSYVQESKAEPFIAILMDIQMPVLDGPGAVRMIRKFEKEHSLKPAFIVMLTGLSDGSVRDECLSLGADDYYVKPVSLKAIDAIFHNLFT